MSKVRIVDRMGCNGFGEVNMTAYAEFNFYVDAEAVKIVSDFYTDIVQLPWNTCVTGVDFDQKDIDSILEIGTDLSTFVIEINNSLVEFNHKLGKESGFILADPGIIALLIDDDISIEYEYANLDVVTEENEKYGMQYQVKGAKNNYKVCKKMDKKKFIKLMIKLIS